MADIAGLSVKLGLVTVEWDAATEKAKRQAKDLRAAFDNLGVGFSKAAALWKQFGGAITAGGFAAIIAQTAEFADEIVDIGNSFELTTQQVLAFRDALAGAGVNAQGATKILSTLYSKIDEGRQGNDKTIAQFEKLGITFAELKNMNTYDAINKVAQGFGNIGDAFERTKMIKEFFGKGGIGLSIEQINEALSTGTKKYDDYADALKKVGVISDNLKRSMDNLKIAVAQMLAPFTSDGIVSIKDFHRTLSALAAGALVAGILSIGAAFVKLALAIKEATAAGALFNLVAMPTNPIGIAIRLLAAGATAIVFFSGGQDNSEKIAKMYNDNPAVKDKLAADAQKRLLFTKEPDGGNVGAAEVNPEVRARQAQVALANQLKKIDADRNKVEAEAVYLGETQTKLRMLDLQLAEKRAQIEAKRQNDLVAARENTPAYRQAINALADAELRTAEQNTEAQKKLAMVMAQRAHDQEQAAQTLHGIEHAAYETSTKAAQSNNEERIAALYQMGKMVDEQMRLNELANQRMEYETSLMGLLPEKRRLLMEEVELEARIAEFVREQEKLGQDPENIKARAKAMRELGRETIAINEENRKAEYKGNISRDIEDQIRLTKLGNQRLQTEMDYMNLQPEVLRVLKARADLEARINEFVVQQQRAGMDNATIQQLAEGMRKAGEQTILLEEQTRQAQTTFSYGWNQAFQNFSEQSTNMANKAASMFNSIVGNMNSAIDNFVRTGKLSFKDFTRSVIQDLIAIQLKYQAMALFRMALGGMGVGAPAMGAPGAGTNVPSVGMGTGGGYADGGDPPVGKASWVGERGPELFVPKSAGTIIPNNQLSSMLGSGQTVNYNGPYIANMSAIDTQSATQFLSKNKQAVWSANQSAQRSLPIGK